LLDWFRADFGCVATTFDTACMMAWHTDPHNVTKVRLRIGEKSILSAITGHSWFPRRTSLSWVSLSPAYRMRHVLWLIPRR